MGSSGNVRLKWLCMDSCVNHSSKCNILLLLVTLKLGKLILKIVLNYTGQQWFCYRSEISWF